MTAVVVVGGCARQGDDRTVPRRGSTDPHARAGSPTATPTATTARPARAVEVAHGPRDVARVALTFHGSGSTALAVELLRAVERARVKITVLAVGTWLRHHPGMAPRILGGGHELGNHTLHHYPMRGLSRTVALDEINGCANILRKEVGDRGRWFRASGTQHTTPSIRWAAGRAGYRTCLSYDVDTLDFEDPGPAAIVHNGVAGARRGSILSLHLGHAGTVAALPHLVHGLQAKGLTPVTVSELLG